MTVYRAPAGSAEAEIRERGSRFRARIAPVRDERQAHEVLDQLRADQRDATHHCWAWRLGPQPLERSADAGEPAGTAGRPILQVLRGAGLADVIAVVTRWYGGTKLGKGGLARAYAGAVKAALADLALVERWPTIELRVVVEHARAGALKRLIQPPEVTLAAEEYGERAHARLVVRVDRVDEIVEALSALGASVER